MAFVNGGATVSCGNVAFSTAGSLRLGSPAGPSGTAQLGPVAITGNLVKPVFIQEVRVLTSTKIRVTFSRAVLNNAALTDPANYAVKGVNIAAAVAVQSVLAPSGPTVLYVDIVVSEMTAWDNVAPITYLVSINANTIALGPQLVADWDMELANTAQWPAYLGATLNKVAGAPAGSGARVISIETVTTFAGARQLGIFAVGGYYRVSAWWRNSLLSAVPAIGMGAPASTAQCFLVGLASQTSFVFRSIDIQATAADLVIGRNGAGGAARAEFDNVSVQRWLPSGGGALKITDAEGVQVVTDPKDFIGKGIAPKILVAYAADRNTIVVQFTEAILDLGSVRTAAAYTANLGLTIQSVASVGVDSVTLKTSNQTAGQLSPLTLTGTWYDTAMNALLAPVGTPVLGFVTPAVTSALLTLRMYNFLIAGIRDADQTDVGARFIERFLEGPQSVWDAIVKTIFDIPKIWSTTDCPDDLLQYLKRIVGWTPDTDSITEALDFAGLRRLIASSVRFWKTRGPEESIEDLLRLTTAARSYVLNWFDVRALLDETLLGEEHGVGTDLWLEAVPGEGADAWTYNIRIVDNGDLNRVLVRDIAKLTRPTGERVLITYLGFLDRFDDEGDETQWLFSDPSGGVISHEVADGALQITQATNFSALQYAFGIGPSADTSFDWSNYSVSWTITHTCDILRLIFYSTFDPDDVDLFDAYYFEIRHETYEGGGAKNLISLNWVTGGSGTGQIGGFVNTLTTFGEPIVAGVKYTWRVVVTPVSAGSSVSNVKLYWDGTLVFEADTSGAILQKGNVGVGFFPTGNFGGNPPARYLDLHECEMFFLPGQTDFIDLGGVVNNEAVTRGPELLADIEFDGSGVWTLGGGITQPPGYLAVVPDGGARTVSQSCPFRIGDVYEVKFTVSNYVAGTVNARLTWTSGIDINTAVVTANGDYVLSMQALYDRPLDGRFALRFDAAASMRIERVSLRRILGPNE
jgi:phage tail-like protein